jgi:hypothetical protein
VLNSPIMDPVTGDGRFEGGFLTTQLSIKF